MGRPRSKPWIASLAQRVAEILKTLSKTPGGPMFAASSKPVSTGPGRT
jgi:hypothetical protein